MGSTCCDEGRGVFVRDGTTQAANPTSTSASSSSTALAVTTSVSSGSSTSVPNPASSPQKSGTNTGAIAGGVVGGVVGLAVILVAVWLVLRRRTDEAPRDETAKPQEYQNWSQETPKRLEPQEAQGSYTGEFKRSELQAGPVDKTTGRAELGTQSNFAANTV